jgi:hypothetical protein
MAEADPKWQPFALLPDWERCGIWSWQGVRCQKPSGHAPHDHEWRHPAGYIRITWPMGFGHFSEPKAAQ